MKDNFVKIVFVIDESGSMSSSRSDVIGGFNEFINDQKKEKAGDVNVSLYTFASTVSTVFNNKNIADVPELTMDNYRPGGSTALNDAVGKAINETGYELAAMPEEERPSVVMMVIMTDGEENNSKEFKSAEIRDMIKHQTDKYSWKFIYLGTDITTTRMSDDMGIKCRGFSSKMDLMKTMKCVSANAANYRNMDVKDADIALNSAMNCMTKEYESKLGRKISNN
jgi:Mg-chelatase subunit ChlD